MGLDKHDRLAQEMNNKQQIFVSAYLKDLNATSAAITAGYSAKTAYSQGQRLLKHVEVKTAIQQKLAKMFGKFEVSEQRTIEEIARIAFADIRKIFDETGQLKPIHELDDDTAAVIAGVEHEKLFEHFGKGQAKHIGTTTKVKMNSKNNALEMLCRYQKLLNDGAQTNVQVNISLAGMIGERRKVIERDDAQPGA